MKVGIRDRLELFAAVLDVTCRDDPQGGIFRVLCGKPGCVVVVPGRGNTVD
jgi:hypothetical protein